MKLHKKIIATALALSVAAGSALCASAAGNDAAEPAPSTTVVQLYKFDSVRTIISRLLKKPTIARHSAVYVTVNDFKYIIHFSIKNGLTAELVEYHGNDTEITVPEFVVKKIPVTKVYSFGELDENYRHSVKTLNLPKTIKSVTGSSVFDLFGLENINVSAENPYITSVDGVVFSKDLSKLLAVPPARTSYDIPDEVTAIGDRACYASSLKSITFPEGLLSIGEYAFFSSPALKEITLPQSTETVGDYAFAHCPNLQKAVVPLETELSYSKVFEAAADNFTALSADTVTLGEEIVIRTYERDDSSTYAFYCKHSSDKKWHTVQNFTDMNIAVICPDKTGDHRICAKIKAPDGTVVKNYCNITVTD